MKKTLVILFLLIGISMSALSQGPPITTETPVMLGLGGNGIRTFGKFIMKENVNIYVHPVGIPYNISTKFQIGAIIPFKRIAIHEGTTTSGIADLAFFSKYQLYKKDGKAKTFRVLAKYQQTFPTANTTESPAIGRGIFQSYFGLIVGKISSKIGIYGDAGIAIREGQKCESFLYNFSTGIPLLPQKYPQKQVNTFLEFNGNYTIKSEQHEVFLSPGIQFIPGRRLLLETSFQLPILQENITTNNTKYRWLLGARFLIN